MKLGDDNQETVPNQRAKIQNFAPIAMHNNNNNKTNKNNRCLAPKNMRYQSLGVFLTSRLRVQVQVSGPIPILVLVSVHPYFPV